MAAVVIAILLLHASAMVFSFTVPKDGRVSRWFYGPSLLIAWLSYIGYEAIYIPANCTGECNIRVDLLLIYPYLACLTGCALAYFVRRNARQ